MESTNENIKRIDPAVFQAVTLDDISRNLRILVDETNNNKSVLDNILNEQISERDEGEYLRKVGTSTTSFTILDVNGILGHCIKGYSFKNDGANTIYLAHNIAGNTLDDSIEITEARFESIYGKEEFKINYNRKKIRNMYFKTDTGDSNYRLTLLW